ncbi:transporter [Methylobacterium sp. Leaf118]|uniref:transporter n=1 Tax=Methylobacterium sp. Leaf118 TaxID=2876562 RepID=UPI001E3D25FA|nr:transporter [Methylobacterium sp. Leaf118]
MMKNWLAAGAIALSAGMTTTAAFAQTTTIPGEQVGLATGAPLPEGVYAINTFTYGGRDQGALDVGFNVPLLVWSTPWVPMGGRLELAVAAPTVMAFGKNGGPGGIRDFTVNVGTFVGAIWAFDLGGNFGVSVLGGAYLNELNGDRGQVVTNAGVLSPGAALPLLASNTYRFGVAGSYTGDGWNVTANLTYNFYDSPATFSGNNVFGTRGPYNISDALNLDLTATKKFGKFEIGAIGYGTVNLDPNLLVRPGVLGSGTIGRGGRFLLGGLIGYDFGPFTTQFYVARTVARTSDAFDSTEGWFRIIAPIYTPPAPVAVAPAPLVRKY